jgi:hypothetical protein
MIDPGRIGYAPPPLTITIDPWQVKLFCRAIGETDPVYIDEDAARAAGHDARLVPPTFLKALETDQCSSAAMLGVLGVPVRSVLHAAQSFDYFGALHVGDRIELARIFSESYDKKAGALTFIVLDSRFHRSSTLLATSRQLIVVRNDVSR